MKRATQVLEHEQRTIRKVVTVMAELLEQLQVCRSVDADLLRDVVQFVRIFCDQCHHAKQESYLFPLLESKGMPTEGSPIIELKEEHDNGRLLTGELSRACSNYIRNRGTGRLELMRALQDVIALYETLLWREEYFLLPMADKMLTAQDHMLLLDQFRAAESDIGVDAHRSYETLADKLQKRADVLAQKLHRAA